MHRIKVVGLKELNRGAFHHIAIIKSNWHSRLQQQGNKISFGRTVLPNLTTWNRATNERLLETRNNKSSSKCSTVNKQKRASMNQLTNQVSTQVTEPDARGGKRTVQLLFLDTGQFIQRGIPLQMNETGRKNSKAAPTPGRCPGARIISRRTHFQFKFVT